MSGAELAAAIEANPETILSAPIRDYLCRLLRGKGPKNRGPKKSSFGQDAKYAVVAAAYEESCAACTPAGPAGRKPSGSLVASHEAAAATIIKRLSLNISPRRLANKLSSRNFPV